MSSPHSRPLLSLTLTLTLLAMFALLLTVIAIHRSDPGALREMFADSETP